MSTINSLYHYTSFDAIVHILDYEQEGLSKEGLLNIRFGDPLKTNDKREIKFFEDYLFTNSDISNSIKSKYDLVKEELPSPFFLSLIHHKGQKWHPKDEIPMWYMYGDYSKGVRIAFEYKKLEVYCNNDGYKLQECSYFNESEMNKKASDLRKTLKQDINRTTWESILKQTYGEVLYYKSKDWEYENEHRIIAWGEDENRILENKDNGKKYYSVPLPIDCVREITIGPLADQMVVERCLKLIKEKLNTSLGERVNFEIKCSKLQIRR